MHVWVQADVFQTMGQQFHLLLDLLIFHPLTLHIGLALTRQEPRMLSECSDICTQNFWSSMYEWKDQAFFLYNFLALLLGLPLDSFLNSSLFASNFLSKTFSCVCLLFFSTELTAVLILFSFFLSAPVLLLSFLPVNPNAFSSLSSC